MRTWGVERGEEEMKNGGRGKKGEGGEVRNGRMGQRCEERGESIMCLRVEMYRRILFT